MTVPGTSLAYGVCSWKSPRTWKDQIIHREKADAMNKTPVMKNGCDLGGCSAILVYGVSSYKELTFFLSAFQRVKWLRNSVYRMWEGSQNMWCFLFLYSFSLPNESSKGLNDFLSVPEPRSERATPWAPLWANPWATSVASSVPSSSFAQMSRIPQRASICFVTGGTPRYMSPSVILCNLSIEL